MTGEFGCFKAKPLSYLFAQNTRFTTNKEMMIDQLTMNWSLQNYKKKVW